MSETGAIGSPARRKTKHNLAQPLPFRACSGELEGKGWGMGMGMRWCLVWGCVGSGGYVLLMRVSVFSLVALYWGDKK
jgi:hypothetical protein